MTRGFGWQRYVSVLVAGLILLVSIFGLTNKASAQSQIENDVLMPANPTIEIVGNERLPDDMILAEFDLPVEPTLVDLTKAETALIDTEHFASVKIEKTDHGVLVTVVEYPMINRVVFAGNDQISTEVLADLVEMSSRRTLRPLDLERDRSAIESFYARGGAEKSEVSATLIKQPKNRYDVVFEIVEKIPGIERIEFTGNRSIDSCTLRRVIATKQDGSLEVQSGTDEPPRFVAYRLLGEFAFATSHAMGLSNPNLIYPERLQLDRVSLAKHYRNNGYADAVVSDVIFQPSAGEVGNIVTFWIEEGRRYHFGDPTVVSSGYDIDVDFQDDVKVRSGRYFDPREIAATIDAMEHRLLTANYSFLRVEPELTISTDVATISPTFRVVQAPRIFVELIDIQGNSNTLDHVIRRQFRLVEGDPFNPRLLAEAAKKLQETEFFDDVRISVSQGSSADYVVIAVDVSEGITSSLSVDANYSSASGFGLGAELEEKNLLGQGQSIEIDGRIATGGAFVRILFTEPAFLDRDIPFLLGLEFTTGEAFDPLTALVGLQVTIWLGFVVIRIPIIVMVLLTSAYYCYVWRGDAVRVRRRYRQMVSRARLVILLQCAVIVSGLLTTATLAVVASFAEQVSHQACQTWSG